MGTIHHLPVASEANARLLEKLVNDMIAQHPDTEVARRWAVMARQSISRYPGPPMPTQPVLDLDRVPGLSESQAGAIEELAEQWLQNYFIDVRDQMMSMHADLLKLQKTIAELQVAIDPSG